MEVVVIERIRVLGRGGGRRRRRGREVVMERVEVEPISIIDQVITRGVAGISHDAKVVGEEEKGREKRDTLGGLG